MILGKLIDPSEIKRQVRYIIIQPKISARLICCDVPLRSTIRQPSLQPFHFLAGDQLVVPTGVTHIFFTATSNTIEGTGEKKTQKTNEQTLGVNSSAEGELCNIVHVQTNASVDSSETSTKLLECRLNLLSLVWTVSLLSRVDCFSLSSLANCQLWAPFPHSLLASPSHYRSREISSPKPFVWFRAKTDKGIVCLAGHLHSVTYPPLTLVIYSQ